MLIKLNNPRYGNVFANADTYAELRSLPTTAIQVGYSAIVNGAVLGGDGLGGLYSWDADSILPDNGSTVLKPSDNANKGRWIKTVGSEGPIGPAGANVSAIGRFADGAGLALPSGANALRTSGYATTGIGLADYAYDATLTDAYLTAYPRSSFKTADGRRFRLAEDGPIDIMKYGAIGDGVTDATAAIAEASKVSQATGRPLYIPTGQFLISDQILAPYGIYGDGICNSVITVSQTNRASWQYNGANKYGAKAAIVVNYGGGGPLIGPVPVHSFRLIGAADRPSARSSDPSTINFLGTGILLTGSSFVTHVRDVRADFFYKGIEFDNYNGHFGASQCLFSNCWYGMYIEKNTGDFRFFDTGLTGNMFAGVGFKGQNANDGTADFGGLTGITMIGCHFGFGPYGMYQDPGVGSVGLGGLVLINCSFEQIGNGAIRLAPNASGGRRVSSSWLIQMSSCNYIPDGSAEAAVFRINGDANFPLPTHAVTGLDLLQGESGIETGAGGFAPGSSGKVFQIKDALAPMLDYRGAWVFDVTNSGGQHIVGTGWPFATTVRIPRNLAISGSTVPVVNFGTSATCRGLQQSEVHFTLNTNNTGGAARVRVNVKKNGVIEAGEARSLIIPAGRATVTFFAAYGYPGAASDGSTSFAIQLDEVPGGITFNSDAGDIPYQSDAILRVWNNGNIN